MSAGPAHGPGRDEDPARHARGPADEAPLPAAGPDPLPACTPDWLDDAGWAASVACGEGEEEPTDPELEDGPPDFEALAAVIAEAREISAAEARDREYAARMVADGGFGLVGAAPGRRGPGQPGSARSFPGEHASPAAGFGSGLALDTAPGCAVLAGFADAVAGQDDRYPGATDDEIVGVICAWDRIEAHAAARKLAAVAEFIRRRPPGDQEKGAPQAPAVDSPQAPAGGGAAEECAPQGPARGGAGTGAGTGAAGMPAGWDEFAAKELAWALAESLGAAEGLLGMAWHLQARLPGTRAALRDGVLSLAKAAIIARATQFLDEDEAAAAEGLVLGRAGRLTPPGLRAAIARAVMEVAPEKAQQRREQAARDARVERWPEDSGNAALAGRELPPADVLAADQRITAWARDLRAAGLDGDMDVLRARAYLDILLGMDSRPTANGTTTGSADGRGGADQPGDADRRGGADQPGDADRRGGADQPGSADRRGGADGPGGTAGGPGSAVLPIGFCGRINLTIPLVTLLGLADRPGEAAGLGPIDPGLARDLARSAARNPKTTWCLTVTDTDGRATGHGCARPDPGNRGKPGANRRKPVRPGGPDPAGRADPAGGTGPAPQPGFSITVSGQPGPPGGYGSWRLRTGTTGQPDLMIPVETIATGDCDHRREARGHDPGVMLRHLTGIRHATCTAPGCRRPAAQCDWEHNTPYEAGGRTCMCNGGPKCRSDHRLKQDPRWKAEQPTPATFRWTTPTGRVYITEPTRYPI